MQKTESNHVVDEENTPNQPLLGAFGFSQGA